ncbi:alpha/beta fold hydrolase [Auraticoccus monumenti]|uniref:Pimeloyl-ACP methyl ester carboxylesterase n=1 Tax=Auraticoccus monumenti TaxID=675864 RepID=A0A1G7DGH9_9ACTN|nr:alpha/beta fold hydrolase [Auraticoccus monumenti]SDE50617.1 Pimeloyl-ACP methyl ester carboxylesterase [Auraticoccus monumenti]
MTSGRLLPPGASSLSVPLGGGLVRTLHAGVPGPRPPLVLVHGGGTDAAALSWYRALPALAVDREVWALDLPGFGATTGIAPLGRPEAMADLVARWMGGLGLAPAVAVGVSMGGDVVLNLALRSPRLLRGLVLVAPGGLVGSVGRPLVHRAAWAFSRLPDPVLLRLAAAANRFSRTALRAMVHDPATVPAEVVEEFVRVAREPRSAEGYLRYNQSTLGPGGMTNQLLGRVGRVELPALFVHGQRDRLVPVEGSRSAVRRMPHARLVELPDVGHWAQLEAHERFVHEVRRFLAELAELPEPEATDGQPTSE